MENKSRTGSSYNDSNLVQPASSFGGELVNSVDVSNVQLNVSCAGESILSTINSNDANDVIESSVSSVVGVSIQSSNFPLVNRDVANPTQSAINSFREHSDSSPDVDNNGDTVHSTGNDSHLSSSFTASGFHGSISNAVSNSTDKLLPETAKHVNRNSVHNTDLLDVIPSTAKNADTNVYFSNSINSTLNSSSDDAVHVNIEDSTFKGINETDKVIVHPVLESKDDIVTSDIEENDDNFIPDTELKDGSVTFITEEKDDNVVTSNIELKDDIVTSYTEADDDFVTHDVEVKDGSVTSANVLKVGIVTSVYVATHVGGSGYFPTEGDDESLPDYDDAVMSDPEVEDDIVTSDIEAKDDNIMCDTEVKDDIVTSDIEAKDEIDKSNIKVNADIVTSDTEVKDDVVTPDIEAKDDIVTFDNKVKDDSFSSDIGVKDDIITPDAEVKDDSVTSNIDVKHKATEKSNPSRDDVSQDFNSDFENRSLKNNGKFAFEKLECNNVIVKPKDHKSGYGSQRFVKTVRDRKESKLNDGFESLRHYESSIGEAEVLPKNITSRDKSRIALSKMSHQSNSESGYRDNEKPLTSIKRISTKLDSVELKTGNPILNNDISNGKNIAVSMPSHLYNSNTKFNLSHSAIPLCTYTSDKKLNPSCFWIPLCTFCDKNNTACIICEDCDFISCRFCFEQIHSLKGECKNHTVVTDLEDVTEDYCRIHNGLLKYYCLNCKKKKCADCSVLSPCCKRHNTILLHSHLSTERQNLKQKQKRISSICAKQTDTMLSAMDHKQDQIQVRWMLEKEMLRQEFISLHDVIMECERSLTEHLEKEVETSLAKLSDLRREYGDSLEQEALLTSETLGLLQDKSNIRFYHKRKTIASQWKKLQEKTEGLPGLGNIDPPFFGRKISLFKEKRHIQECLKTENFISMKIRPISHCLYFEKEMLSSPIRASELWQPPASSLPSTEISYKVQIRSSMKKIIWDSVDPISIDDIVCNGDGKLLLFPLEKYLLKVTPIFKTTVYESVTSAHTGEPSFILLVTGIGAEPMDTEDDIVFTPRLLLNIGGVLCYDYSFEELRHLSRSQVRRSVRRKTSRVVEKPEFRYCSMMNGKKK